MRMKKDKIWAYIFVLPSVVIFLTFYALPIIMMAYTSFTKWDGYNAPVFKGLINYINLFTQDSFLISLKNLFWWTVIAAVIHVGYGVIVGFILYTKPFGWKFVRGVYMIPNVISAAAMAMVYKFVFMDEFGVLNTIIRIFNPNFHVNWFFKSPYAFWTVTFTWVFYAVVISLIVLSELNSIPKELHESAFIDGASQIDIALRINLPLCKHAIGTGVILAITSRIAMYEPIALTTRGGPGEDTMNIPLLLVRGIRDMHYGYANASAVVMFLLGIVTLLLVNWLFKMKESAD